MRDVAIQGYVFRSETIMTRNGRQIQTLYVTDYTDSILVKRFEDKNKNAPEELAKLAKGGKWVKLKGTLEFDTYAKELAIITRDIDIIDIGPSSIDGVPDYGLLEFKESIGCSVCSKYWLKL